MSNEEIEKQINEETLRLRGKVSQSITDLVILLSEDAPQARERSSTSDVFDF